MRAGQSIRRLRMPKRSKYLPKVLTVGEVERLLDAPCQPARKGKLPELARERRWLEYCITRDAAILEVLYSAGILVSELTALNADRWICCPV